MPHAPRSEMLRSRAPRLLSGRSDSQAEIADRGRERPAALKIRTLLHCSNDPTEAFDLMG
jgi:hypothetical protein